MVCYPAILEHLSFDERGGIHVHVLHKTLDFVPFLVDELLILSSFSILEPDGSVSVGQTAYSLLSDSRIMSDKYKTQTKSLHNKYFPLEFNPAISFDDKYKLMDEWWAGSNQALLDEHPTLETLYKAVPHAKLQLRPGFATAVQLAHLHDIPVIVFSAGISEVIQEILRRLGPTDLMLPNVHVVANELEIDQANFVVGFKPPLMHSLNKKDTSVSLVRDLTREWFKPLRKRHNVLLMGDNLGDAQMSQGYEVSDDPDVCILKVGFLNDNVDALLPQYAKAFDIVVLYDGPMVPVASFLTEIISVHAPRHPDFKPVAE